MKKIITGLAIILLVSTICFALPVNEKYSYKDFTGKKLLDVDVKELNNTVIRGSCFYQEKSWDETKLYIKVFPDGMTGVTFDRCNVDNVEIPEGNIALPNCNQKTIKVQNDWADWELEKNGTPKEPLNKKDYLDLGISIKPKDIPKTKLDKCIIDKKREEVMSDD
jgi:hypothetical protein